ncbi:MAG: hypothetical protein LBQ44_11135, partial [Treponema sp.]|nr:hypothetical protein [Treponema sp.]
MKWSFIKAFPSLILLFISLPLMGGIRFSGLDLDEDNRLLFKAEVREKESPVSARETPGSARGTLFLSDLKGESISPLSAVSGKMELLDGVLWVRGAYGVQHIPVGRPGSSGFPSPALPRTAPGFPVFTAGSAPGSHIETIVPSGDGRWVLFVEPVSYARGNLALVNGESGAKTVIAAGVDNPGRAFPAVWSSDSRGFVYAKNRKLYYYPVDSVNAPPPERYRLIGEGTIDQIRWGGGGNFYYLRGSTVYRIRGPELFARTPYSNFLDMGEVAGTIPFEFDPNFDSFWIAGAGEPQPDGLMIPLAEALILAKGGRNIFCYILNTANASAPRYPAEAMPYLMLPRSSSSIRVLCSSRGLVTILAAPYGGENSGSGGNTLAYRINLNPAGTAMAFSVLRAPPSLSCALSPDGTKLCFWGRGGIQIYDYERWRPVAAISSQPASAALWASKDELITGGAEKIEYLKFSGADIEERKLLCLAGVDEAGFERRRGFIAARSGSAWYLSDGKSPWAETERPELKAPSPASPSYRVYLEQGYGLFENVPMVRNLGSVGTRALIPPRAGPEGKGPSAPVLGGSGGISGGDTEGLFSHGLRKYRKAALCFDLYDDDAGLSLVLDALDRFGVRATFFLNGEF